jgi:prophage antirepressor-like protein
MSEQAIQTFSSNLDGATVAIAAMTVDGESWFRANDVAAALGYARPKKAIMDHVFDVFKKPKGELLGGGPNLGSAQEMDHNTNLECWIREPGVFQLALKSKLPRAEAFQLWVCSEVLPSIRRTGSYTDPRRQELDNERLAIENNVARQRGEIEVATLARQALLNAYGALDDAQEWAYRDRVSNVLRGEAAPNNQELTHAGLFLADRLPAAQVRRHRAAFGRICARLLRAKLGTSDLPKARKDVNGTPCDVVVFRVPQDLDVLEAGLQELLGDESESEAPTLRRYFRPEPY